MAKFYGAIGYAETEESSPGVFVETIVERNSYGDWIRNTSRVQSSEHLNDDITIANELSILADPYANNHFHSMRYIVYAGAKWKVTNVNPQFPRLILTVGGVYNE